MVGIMTPSPPRQAGSYRSMEPNAGWPVIAGRKRRLRTSSSGWKSSVKLIPVISKDLGFFTLTLGRGGGSGLG